MTILYKEKSNKVHLVNLIIFLFFFSLALFSVFFKERVDQVAVAVLDSGHLQTIFWAYVSVSIILSRFQRPIHGNKDYFDLFVEPIFLVATYGLAGSTSLSLLRGVYLELFHDRPHFIDFSDIDLASVAIVSSYLLIYSIMKTTKELRTFILRTQSSNIEIVR